MYSDKINYYLNLDIDFLVLPDDVMLKEGVSCGDSIIILGENNKNRIDFKILSKGCELCTAVSNYLTSIYSGMPGEDIKHECTKLMQKIALDHNYLFQLFELKNHPNRFQCLYAPIELLNNFVDRMLHNPVKRYELQDTISHLDCDACVSSCNINWSGKWEKSPDRVPGNEYSTEFRKKWGHMAKICLSPEEVALLQKNVSNVSKFEFDYFHSTRIDLMLFANIKKYGIDVSDNPLWQEVIYKVHRKHIVLPEVERAQEFIENNHLPIYSIKGAQSNRLYSEGEGIRVHKDYDYIALSSESAFQLASFLFSKGFVIASGVFSIKKVVINGNIRFSGHFHLRKVLHNQFEVVIDINYPGFPLGRIDLYNPLLKGNCLSDEEQFMITLCHAFKHRDVPMKDLNDLYLMMQKRELDYEYILQRIQLYGLEFYASMLFGFIFDHYDFDETTVAMITRRLRIDKEIYRSFPHWPFDPGEELKVKQRDLDKRSKEKIDYMRIYLSPLIVYKENSPIYESALHDLGDAGYTVDCLGEYVWEATRDNIGFILTSMGIFIDTYADVVSVGREKIKCYLRELLSILGVKTFYDVMVDLHPLTKWF